MAYVLIVVLHAVGGGNFVTMQDFTSKEKCEAAKGVIVATTREPMRGAVICVEK